MPISHLAEVVRDGDSQVVRIPAEFHLDSETVEIRRNDETGELILAAPAKRLTWDEFFDLVSTLNVPEDYMTDRPMNRLPVERKIFEDE